MPRRFPAVLRQLQSEVGSRQHQPVHIYTYAGAFEPQMSDGEQRSASFEAYLRYANANPRLRLAITSTIGPAGGTETTAEHISPLPASIRTFHIAIRQSSAVVAGWLRWRHPATQPTP